MKKGLRHTIIFFIPKRVNFNRRPDEEGIKTHEEIDRLKIQGFQPQT